MSIAARNDAATMRGRSESTGSPRSSATPGLDHLAEPGHAHVLVGLEVVVRVDQVVALLLALAVHLVSAQHLLDPAAHRIDRGDVGAARVHVLAEAHEVVLEVWKSTASLEGK